MKKMVGSGSRNLIGIIFLTVIIGITGSCSESGDPMDDNGGNGGGGDTPGANEVWIKGSAFGPSSITISAGTTITWTNKDAVVHTVTSDNGLFDSGNLTVNSTFSRQFTTPGTYPYHCTPHPAMTATVIVN
jgi:plastocyanin